MYYEGILLRSADTLILLATSILKERREDLEYVGMFLAETICEVQLCSDRLDCGHVLPRRTWISCFNHPSTFRNRMKPHEQLCSRTVAQ